MSEYWVVMLVGLPFPVSMLKHKVVIIITQLQTCGRIKLYQSIYEVFISCCNGVFWPLNQKC